MSTGNATGRRALRDAMAPPPWYRQFWPWFLIALPGSVVIAAFCTLYIAVRYSDDLVQDDYYKSGLAINRRLEQQRAAAELGLDARVTILDERLQLRLEGLPGTPDLRLRLYHPLEADRDFAVRLRASAPGLYVSPLPDKPAPNWHWALDTGSDSSWRLNGSLAARDFLALSRD